MTVDLKAMAADTAIENMLRSKHFSICTVDTVCAALSIVPDKEAYSILRMLHCVNYIDMPPELRKAIPGLLTILLGDYSESIPVRFKILG